MYSMPVMKAIISLVSGVCMGLLVDTISGVLCVLEGI